MNQFFLSSPKPRFMKVKMDEQEQRSFSREYKKRSDALKLSAHQTSPRPMTVDSRIEGNKAIRSNSLRKRQHSLHESEQLPLEQDIELLNYLFQLKSRQESRYKSRILKLHEKKLQNWKNYRFPQLFTSVNKQPISDQIETHNLNNSNLPMNLFIKQQYIKNPIY